MAKYSDQEILEGLKNRKNEIIEYTRKKFSPPIVYMVERMGGCRQDAEDIFQEAMINIIVKIDKDKLILTCKLLTYFYAICKNMWLMQWNKKKREDENTYVYINDIYYPEPAPSEEKELRVRKFLYYFDKMSKVCKEILKFYSYKVPVKEIAEELGNSEKYIRRRKYECKNRLLMLIEENTDDVK